MIRHYGPPGEVSTLVHLAAQLPDDQVICGVLVGTTCAAHLA
jgi:hypothetical protein